MNITQSVSQQIERMQSGKLFSYQDIPSYSENGDAVVKAISRNMKKLGLVKIKKGLFYKSEIGRFGPMTPKSNDVIQYFTSRKNKIIGYITGPELYYRWGLTTQIPAEITIATSSQKREKANLSGLRIMTTPARYKVTKNNVQILQFLDILKNIERVPDTQIQDVSIKLAARLNTFSSEKISEMEKIAIEAYSERTKALLGFFLETYMNYFSDKLKSSLNPTSKYVFNCAGEWKNAQKNWRLVSSK